MCIGVDIMCTTIYLIMCPVNTLKKICWYFTCMNQEHSQANFAIYLKYDNVHEMHVRIVSHVCMFILKPPLH
jgi:hypothetical protein